MPDSLHPLPTTPPLPAGLARAWIEQSPDPVVLTDPSGRIAWFNHAFAQAFGPGAAADLLELTPPDWQRGEPRRSLQSWIDSPPEAEVELRVCGAAQRDMWVRLRVLRWEDLRLWTLRDITGARDLTERAEQLSELLEMVQDFGRMGIWQRSITSGQGQWNRQVFGFWGIAPHPGAPDHADVVARIHADDGDTGYLQSTQQAGRYSKRYRVVRSDGTVRQIHSQWEVKNSSDGRPDRAIGIVVDDTEAYELAASRDTAAAQLKLAVELANLVIWRHDLRTDLITYNPHGLSVLGMTSESGTMPLEEARTYTHPDDRDKLLASAQRALEVDEPVDVEVRHLRRDGTQRYVLMRRVVERDPAGRAIAFVGIALDVTDRVAHLRRAEQLALRLEAAAQAAQVGIWTTTAGTIQTEWNDQMYELFDMVGAARPPTLREWITLRVHPDDARRVSDISRHYLSGPSGIFEIEFRIRRRDGQIRWMVIRADIDRSSAEHLRIFGIAMDVTDRNQARAALRIAGERAAMIARHAGIGTWETDDERTPPLWDEQMFLLRGLAPRATALDREERMALVHPDDRTRVMDANPFVEDNGQPMAYEFRVRLPDGRYRWLASRSAALRDERGQVVRRMGVNWDITESKSADLARQQALLAERESEAKSQFLSRMSHELRTPLNAVLGFTQLLQLEALNSGNFSQSTQLEHIRTAGEHLLTLINDALDLSSLQTGTLRLAPQPLSMRAAVEQALPLVLPLARSHGVSVSARRLDGQAMADPTRVQQVLLNLLTNAIKYNRAGGQVQIEAQPAGDRVRLSVSDTGRGIQADQLAHLFEPFNRLGVQEEGIEGSGIGLTIVKALVEGMQGQIQVTSKEGHGTTFVVELPVAAPGQAQVPAQAPAQRTDALPVPVPGTRSGLLLYVEDNSVNVLLVEELVKNVSGLQIVCASTGAQGVELARRLRPGVILVDMQLPDFDGFEVLRRLRADVRTATLTCIALSANAMPEDVARGLAGGFDDYWTKPIKFKPFLEALERLFPASPASPASPALHP